MNQAYEKFYNSRFYNYFSMMVEEKNRLEMMGIQFLFVQTPLRQNIAGLTEFEEERLDNWKFDFNHISKQDCEIIKQIYSDDVDIDYLQQLYDGNKVYEQNGVKYLSDFKSKYVNIVAGKRITEGNPVYYKNKIWIYGQCTVRGTGVEDAQTIPSYLQKMLKEHYKKYRVINCATGCGSDIYDDIMHMKEERIRKGDIVIFCTNLEIVPTELFEKEKILYYDCSEVFHRPHMLGEWFTDSTFHTTAIGNKQIANYIFSVLEKEEILNDTEYTDTEYIDSTTNDIDIEQYGEELKTYLLEIKKYRKEKGRKGCIVMNCNPFTNGHLYLIEYAASQVEYLYIFVVQEDKSFFKYDDRYKLVQQGTKHLKNVIVLPSGKFIISAITFPGYFHKEDCKDISIDTSMDIKIFGQYISPALDISVRYAGTEPTDVVTRQYNETMREYLPLYGIEFVQIERKQEKQSVISASMVRRYLKDNDFEKIKILVPKTTYNYLKDEFVLNTIGEIEKKDCCGCEACVNRCKVGAINMVINDEGFYYPVIDYEKCIRCGRCKNACPIINIDKKEMSLKDTDAYACYNKDDEIRKISTSGGVFSLLAEYIIKKKHGVVYGARFDEEYNVYHDRAITMEEIASFRGSKYVQSRIYDVYSRIKEDLEFEKTVLFTGLPCQTEALLNYLEREYDNLYCMDMVCFGIGAPGIWDEYLKNYHSKENITQVTFKDKVDGWKNWKTKIVEDNKEHYYSNRENFYMNSFLKRINIRMSCFECQFKGITRRSDITIADCWGIGEQSMINDDKGLSALLVHSDKGKKLFDYIKENMCYAKYDAYELMEGNWATLHSPSMNEQRKEFMKVMSKEGIKDAMTKFCTFQGIGE